MPIEFAVLRAVYLRETAARCHAVVPESGVLACDNGKGYQNHSDCNENTQDKKKCTVAVAHR